MKIFQIILFVVLVTFTTSEVINLTDKNWKDILNDEWLILLFAPWCPACQTVKPIFEELGKVSKIKIASIDITENPVAAGSFMVSRLPSIYHVKSGEFRFYDGARTLDDLTTFYESTYTSVAPVAWYFNPGSYHMNALGYLFKLSQVISKMQSILENDYGVSAWITYVIIVVCVIGFGILISIIIVCVCDMLLPPRPQVKKYLNQVSPPAPYLTKDTDPDNDTFPEKSETSLNNDDDDDDSMPDLISNESVGGTGDPHTNTSDVTSKKNQ